MQRAQSAMEYLTTYGWTVLVLAVVVVVLLKAGIFGSSASQNACVAISGFSCASPSLSSNGLLTTLFGEVGQMITISAIACTKNSTLTGGVSAMNSITSVTLSSTQKTTLGFMCPISSSNVPLGTKFNGYLWVQYTTKSGQPVVQRVGEVASSVTSVGTPSLGHSLSFRVTNSQGSGTGSNFQQMITFNPSNAVYKYAEHSDLGNIRFYQGGTQLYSWCESGCTSSSSNAVFWVNLASGIAANSNTIVNAYFLSNTLDYNSSYAGECPECSVTGTSIGSAPSYNTNFVSSGTGSPSMNLNSNSNTVICGVAMSYPVPEGDQIGSTSFIQNISDISGPTTAIGLNSGYTCSGYTVNGTTLLMGGIGINNVAPAYFQNFGEADNVGSGPTVSYTASSSNSLMVIVVACAANFTESDTNFGGACVSPYGSLSGSICGPAVSQEWFGDASIEVYACKVGAGSGSVQPINNAGAADMSVAIYIFAAPSTQAGYGQYDNGANVFTYYTNFPGPGLPSGFTVVGSPGYSVNDGLLETRQDNADFIASSSSFNSNSLISEMYGNQTNTGGNDRTFSIVQSASGTAQGIYFEGPSGSQQSYYNFYGGAAGYTFPGTTLGTKTEAVFSLWESGTTAYGMYNYAQGTVASAVSLTTSYYQLGGSGSQTNYYQWLRQRLIPPGDVMPTFVQQTFG